MARSNKCSPPSRIAQRLAECRRRMVRHKLPAYLLTRRADTFYMTGFTGEDSAVIVTPRAVDVVSDGRFDQTIDREVPWAKKHLRKQMLPDEIGHLCRRLKLSRLAVQPDAMTLAMYGELRTRTRPTRLVKAPPIVNRMRGCKDSSELRSLGKAIDVAQQAFAAVKKYVRVGRTEQELAARLEYEMRKRGSSRPAFETICAIGPSAALPHARPGRRRVKPGSVILFDWGATVGFYRSDLTRCLFIGRIPPKIGAVYNIVLEAQEAAIEAIRPGERMCDVDAVARGIIADAGYKNEFVHGLGHGLGLDVHEPPALNWRSKERLAAGNVVTVEPGIYLPGIGGVRIEDDVLVTSHGHRVLSNLTKDLRKAVL
ncbi:MAG: aminopeptidase P family protein [Phycisphaerae bacterium]